MGADAYDADDDDDGYYDYDAYDANDEYDEDADYNYDDNDEEDDDDVMPTMMILDHDADEISMQIEAAR